MSQEINFLAAKATTETQFELALDISFWRDTKQIK
jgi:hypothetical protein